MDDFESVFWSLPGYVYWYDCKKQLIGCNKNFLHLLQKDSLEDIYGSSHHDMPWKEHAHEIMEAQDKAIATQQNQIVTVFLPLDAKHKTTYKFEISPIVHADAPATETVGVIRIFSDALATSHTETSSVVNTQAASEEICANKDHDLLIQHIHDVYYQVTGQKPEQNEDAVDIIDQVRHYYEYIIDHMPGHVFWLDRNLRYRGSNILHARNAGFSNPKDIIGRTNAQTSWHAEASKLDAANEEVLRTGQTIILEESGTNIFGTTNVYLTHKVPLRDRANNFIGVLGISLDISDRKQAEHDLQEAKEEAERANAAKSKFILNMGHDLRTPLIGIIGLSELILQREDDDEKKNDLRIIHSSAEKLLDLFQQIIELIRLKDNQPVVRKEFLIMDVLNDVLTMLQPQFKFKNINLSTTVDPILKRPFQSDILRIHRILLNLISNALKFTKHGKISIDVSLVEQTANQMQVKICVTDTGIGIPIDKQGEIFDMFTKLSSSFEGIYNGLGLGLYITKQFVEDLGGKIWVQSEVGEGTTFSCILPLQLINTIRQVKNDSELYDASSHEQLAKNILIIEDNLIAQRILYEMLLQCGCNVSTATTGQRAIEIAQQKNFDLIITDIGLPDIDSFMVTQIIRATANPNTQTPIVGLTAHFDATTQEKGEQAGMNCMLAKPIKLATCKQLLSLKFAADGVS